MRGRTPPRDYSGLDELVVRDKAMQYALNVLGYRARSEAEMRRKLDDRGFPPKVTDATLQELTRLGLLDDREFAASWVNGHASRGPVRLRYEMRQKGIAADLAEEIITALRPEGEDLATALRLALKARRGAEPPDRAALARIRQMLARRGFTPDVVNQVCARLAAGSDAGEDWTV